MIVSRSHLRLRKWIFPFIAAIFVIACAAKMLPPDGQMMVVIKTDLAPLKDYDVLHIEAKKPGQPSSFYANDFFFTGSSALKVPGTVNFVGSADRQPIEILVEVRKGGSLGPVRVRRNVRTVIPSDRVAQLDMPLQYLCIDKLDCGEGKTCVMGSCENNEVKPEDLPTYDPGGVFGGGSGKGDGTCFDTLACFTKESSPVALSVENNVCVTEKPTTQASAGQQAPSVINLAILLPAKTDGICGANACLVPLDRHKSPLIGWNDEGDKITLPMQVCERNLKVVVSTSCAAKTPSTPTCGPWSSVGNASADPNTILPFDPDASARCVEGARDCAGRIPRQCKGGTYVPEAECSGVCNKGNCTDCIDGTKSCGSPSISPDGGGVTGSTFPRTCTNGTWQPLAAQCPGRQLCAQGECRDREWAAWTIPGTGTLPDGATPRLLDSNYEIDGDIVLDKTTKLEWLRIFPTAPMDLPTADNYCLTRNTRGGGWRVPTVKELVTLIDYGAQEGPLINENIFPGLDQQKFMFRTVTHPPQGGVAEEYTFNLNFMLGIAQLTIPTADQYVRCVR